MPNLLNRFHLAGLLVAASSIHGVASPAQSNLLRLIPREAQLVAGVEDPRNPDTRGHLLLVTARNTFDFDDWQSLTGVDPHRAVDEQIWVAASSPESRLGEHMLLVAGLFDRGHIFAAAERNGATAKVYRGVEVLAVTPFAREQEQMPDTRWIAILDGRTAVFGTPWLVKKTLDRYVDHAAADPLLADRVGRLNPKVNSWDLILTPHAAFSKHAALEKQSAPWMDLLGREMLENAEELTLGIRFGTIARVDFIVRTADDSNASGAAAHRPIAETSAVPASNQLASPRLEDISNAPNLTVGTIALPGKQLYACFKFASCGESATALHSAQ
jgi:hypothetical protein